MVSCNMLYAIFPDIDCFFFFSLSIYILIRLSTIISLAHSFFFFLSHTAFNDFCSILFFFDGSFHTLLFFSPSNLFSVIPKSPSLGLFSYNNDSETKPDNEPMLPCNLPLKKNYRKAAFKS